MERPKMILMRGLPSCGKSTTARALAGENGVVLEFDRFFIDTTGTFRWRPELRPRARRQVLVQLLEAIARKATPIVLDDDHGLGGTTRAYVLIALANGYDVRLQEPLAPWWSTVRRLMEQLPSTRTELAAWAQKLSLLNRTTHGVSAREIQRRMDRWPVRLDIQDICRGSIARMAPAPQSSPAA